MNPWENDPVVTSGEAPWRDDPVANKKTIADRASPMERLRAREQAMAGTYQDVIRKNIVEGQQEFKAHRDRMAEPGYSSFSDPYLRERAANVALGFTGGGFGKNALEARMMPKPMPAPVMTPAEAANAAGFSLLPSQANGGVVSNALAGLSGEAKTAQLMSVKNQSVVNKMAARWIDLPENTTLTDKVLADVKKTEGQSYENAAGALGSPFGADAELAQKLDTLGTSTRKDAAIDEIRDRLKAAKNDGRGWIEEVKELRAEAKANFKGGALGDPVKTRIARAQKDAADSIDDMIERQLKAGETLGVVRSGLFDAYKGARTKIAKVRQLEDATNRVTGDVDARALSNAVDRGAPISGELRVAADAAAAFPKVFQNPATFGGYKPVGVADTLLGLVGAVAHPALLAGVAARPIARELAASRIMQNALARPPKMYPRNSLAGIVRPSQAVSQPAVPTYSAPSRPIVGPMLQLPAPPQGNP